MATLTNEQLAAAIEARKGDLHSKGLWRACGAPYPLVVEALRWLDSMHLTVKHHRRQWLIDWRDAVEIIRETPMEFDNGKMAARNLGAHLDDEDKGGSRVVFLSYPLDGLPISLTQFVSQYLHGWLKEGDGSFMVRYDPVNGRPIECLFDHRGLWKNGRPFHIGDEK